MENTRVHAFSNEDAINQDAITEQGHLRHGTAAGEPLAMASEEGPTIEKCAERVVLVVVDDTSEMAPALRFACRRAYRTGGRVALLRVLAPADFQHWGGIGKLMNAEAREEAEQALQGIAAQARAWSGSWPLVYIRQGALRDQLLAQLDDEPQIAALVLGAAMDAKGPGPLVSSLTGRFINRLHIPLIIVPGNLSPADIDALS